ncbi:MAG: hypothetical protein FJZ80_08100 [Bacteroidetes bacterium]|nr:hypothetical protein [Bacteroidota bacterium]MBM3424606.1 hypothetical protein [Bacteroidota bacterium]
MKKRWVLLVSSILCCAACNKEKRYTRYLQGTWNCAMVRLQNADGFTFFDHIPNGNLSFSETSVQGLVVSDFVTFQGNVVDSLNLNGNYVMHLENNELNWLQDNDTLKNRIFVITRDDLELEYYDPLSNCRFRYVFEKQ